MSSISAQREAEESDSELISQRVPGPVEWVLFTGNRGGVAAGLLIALFVVLGGLFRADLIAVANDDSLTRSFAALIGGNLTLITIVISINQLILSREFSSPGELHERIQEIIAYRQEVAEMVETNVSPATPDAFLDFLVTILREETVLLRDGAESLSDEDLQADLNEFTDTLISQAESISETLEGSSKGPFETLVIVLDAGFAADLYNARRIQTIYGESLPSEAETQLKEIINLLEHIGVARQHLKILYFQRELADLSRKVLYVGVPALGLLLITTWVYGAEPTPTIQGLALPVLVNVTGTVAFAPLAVFFAYVLRIATITRRTASLVPFTIQEQSPL